MAARKKVKKPQVIVDEEYLDALQAFTGDVDDVLGNGITAEDFKTLNASLKALDKMNSEVERYTPPAPSKPS